MNDKLEINLDELERKRNDINDKGLKWEYAVLTETEEIEREKREQEQCKEQRRRDLSDKK